MIFKRSFLAIFCAFIFQSIFAQVSIDQKIGQLIIVGFTTSQEAKDSLIYDIQERNLGGVLLFGYNLQDPTQMLEQSNELKAAAQTPLFVATDQEGGRVARLSASNGFESTQNAQTLGEVYNSEDSTRALAHKMATWLEEVGINVNFAPVVDVNVNRNSPAIGKLKRSFSPDPARVFQHATYFADEFHKKNIITALKHFPGHGSAVSDSHNGFTDISTTWQTYELDPFRNMIANGYQDMIMTGHLFKSDWDNVYPTSLSYNALTTILRDSLHFKGVIISDELFMQAISNNFGFDEAIIQSIKAGNDIMLFNNNLYQGGSLTKYIVDLVKLNIANNTLNPDLIDLAYNRVMALKNRRLSTSIEEQISSELPTKIHLQNYPNPFNPSTTILLSLPKQGNYTLTVYSILGEKVATLHNGFLNAGTVSFSFDASKLASGIYFTQLSGAGINQTIKMSLVK